MRKLLIFIAIAVAAGYVATNYLGKVGPTVTGNVSEAERVLQDP